MKHLKKFEEKSLYESYINNSPILPNVSYILDTNEVFYNPFIDTNVYEWVDLGLPSGLKWAAWNVGAEKPEDFGLYFAWGETRGYEDATADKQFVWDDYKFGTTDALTKYNEVDGLTVLELEDDAAYQSDNTCRMPTKYDFEELRANTTYTQETLNGVNGGRFTSNKNGNSIFIPAAGSCQDGSVNFVGELGFFLSSSLDANPRYCKILGPDPYSTMVYDNDRCHGCSVRAVKSIN